MARNPINDWRLWGWLLGALFSALALEGVTVGEPDHLAAQSPPALAAFE